MNDIESVRWQAVEGRDARMDGVFVYSVRTTGVYCRPGCAARRPRRQNVLFFATPADAVVEGFRACRRCRPDGARIDDPGIASVVAVCRWLEHPDEDHAPDVLAGRVGWSKRHLQRRFSEVVGVSMAAYGRAMQAERARLALQRGGSVTDAVFDAGYGSTRAFYEHGAPRLGMSAAAYAAAGRGHRVAYATFPSPIGEVIVAATERGLCAIRIGDDPAVLAADLTTEYAGATVVEDPLFVADLARRVADLAAGTASGSAAAAAADLPLDIRGTAFQVSVWEHLRTIPVGTTETYAEVADAIGRPTAVRAVANACGANPVAVAIPCHRVVRSDGTLGGYRWGIERKAALLAAERRSAGKEQAR
ncbi:MAG: AraC family transcriptional regulator [Actinomycetota bacterium]|nr:AraC family transcriptional regulator [Actinomycetota bacterium]